MIVAGCGELHIEICINDLQKEYAGCPIKTSKPVVTYKETITADSSEICMTKTQNKLNRLYATSSPLGEELQAAIEKNEITEV